MGNSIGTIIGKKIRELRQKQGLTQEQLSELIKTSYKYMQRIEGKTPPDIRMTTLKRLATALKTTPSKIIEGI